MIKLTCKNCGKHLQAPDESAGRKGKCPGCGEVFAILEVVLPPGGSAGSWTGQDKPGGGNHLSIRNWNLALKKSSWINFL